MSKEDLEDLEHIYSYTKYFIQRIDYLVNSDLGYMTFKREYSRCKQELIRSLKNCNDKELYLMYL